MPSTSSAELMTPGNQNSNYGWSTIFSHISFAFVLFLHQIITTIHFFHGTFFEVVFKLRLTKYMLWTSSWQKYVQIKKSSTMQKFCAVNRFRLIVPMSVLSAGRISSCLSIILDIYLSVWFFAVSSQSSSRRVTFKDGDVEEDHHEEEDVQVEIGFRLQHNSNDSSFCMAP